MKVLLVVDPQVDFCPGGALAVEEGDRIVPVVNRLMNEGGYDLVFISQDWHPADHSSFAANNPGAKPFEAVTQDGKTQVLWPVHCVQGSHGAEFHPELRIPEHACVVQKGMDRAVDSYSAFMDNDRRSETRLRAYLVNAMQAAQCTPAEVDVDVAGLALDYCVKATALDAATLGFRTTVLLDAARAVDPRPETVASVLRELRDGGVEVCESRERFTGRELSRDTGRSAGIER